VNLPFFLVLLSHRLLLRKLVGGVNEMFDQEWELSCNTMFALSMSEYLIPYPKYEGTPLD
jgi:hypothetical protein